MVVDKVYLKQRPEDKRCTSYDVFFGDRSNIARIEAYRSIVAKNEVLVGWNMPGLSTRVEWCVCWCIDVGFFVEEYFINPDVGTICRDCISWQSNYTFHQIFITLLRIVKHDYVSACWAVK